MTKENKIADYTQLIIPFNFGNTIKLMRIPFSFFLMPVFLFALSQVNDINWSHAILCFIVLHLFIYPASNGYNSYMDKDETPIGGLEHPPKPTKMLFYTSILFDALGLLISLIINIQFFFTVLAYLLASRAYSWKGIRLKKFPILGFLTVIFFQGAFTFWMVYSCISNNSVELNNSLILVLIGCSFLIAGVYPLTQIYQHKEDAASGDITISYKLGIKGTFKFSSVMFIISNIFLYNYFKAIHKSEHFILFQLFLIPVGVYFITWFLKVLKDNNRASFKNTMRMNLIASTSLNVCFIFMIILNNSK